MFHRTSWFSLALLFSLSHAVAQGPDSGASPAMRTWTDATGKFNIMARLLSHTGDTVRLKRVDGAEIEIPLVKLSQADQQFLKQQARSPAEASPVVPSSAAAPKTSPEPPAPRPEFVDLGESFLPADSAPATAPLRAKSDLTTYKLSNVRVGGSARGPKLTFTYELIGVEKWGNPALVIRFPDGNERRVLEVFSLSPRQSTSNSGDLSISVPGAGPRGGGFPSNVEIYLVHFDDRWAEEGMPLAVFKISNSAVAGEGQPTVLARDWTKKESQLFERPPPLGPKTGENPEVGVDGSFVEVGGGIAFRYVDAQERTAIGFAYYMPFKEIISLQPVFDPRQYVGGFKKALAKPGYALGGFNMKCNKTDIVSIQPIYMKIQSDGSLDAQATQLGAWIGGQEGELESRALSGEGKRVIGLHLRIFGAVKAVALVLPKQ